MSTDIPAPTPTTADQKLAALAADLNWLTAHLRTMAAEHDATAAAREGDAWGRGHYQGWASAQRHVAELLERSLGRAGLRQGGQA
ncbi:MAG: hypothetical protein IT318_24900 [Anaerolineales bacterium]|nr:hypothetical protein [Anaerolineales bacterium]